MKFIKLHQDGCELLVNFSLVTEVYPKAGTPNSNLYLIAAEEDRLHSSCSNPEVLLRG